MKLNSAQMATYQSFSNKQAAEEYKAACLPKNHRRTESKKIYHNPHFYLSEIEEEIWNQDKAEFKIETKLCSELELGDIFRSPKMPDFCWHQFRHFVPQTVLKNHRLIKSLLLPYRVEAEIYFDANFKFFVAANSHDFIIY